LGPQQLKGFAEAQRAWRVIGENRALGRFEALRMGTAPLVGREEELELLLRRWAQSKVEGERVVVLSAEPGIGKLATPRLRSRWSFIRSVLVVRIRSPQ
jgi:hypothetical protein